MWANFGTLELPFPSSNGRALQMPLMALPSALGSPTPERQSPHWQNLSSPLRPKSALGQLMCQWLRMLACQTLYSRWAGNAFISCGDAFTSCGDAFTSCGDAFTSCGDAFTSCSDAFTSCGDAFTSCGNAFTSCGDAFTSCGNAFISCGNAC